METQQQQQQQNIIEKQLEGEKNNHSIQLLESPKHPSSSPSSSSSPSHEFSFTISLHSSSTTIHDKSKPQPSSLALDLSPADDIFFHGHLLPLHLLSHFPSSPRFSTNSMDSFTLPIKDLLLEDEKTRKDIGSCSNREQNNNNRTKEESYNKSNNKSSSFSLFGLTKGNSNSKGCHQEKQKKKLGYDMIHALKKYLRMVQPLVLFRGKREKNRFHGEAYSRSGNLIRKNKPEVRGSRGEYSAPASMRTSPTNSGLLLATSGAIPCGNNNNDSTMEELQAAIQAAIAHCKSSIAKQDKINC
ncbi:BRI1 kinase inhibitor 1 [Cicer arietinum]|uniref:BRI1 kinase inhibitor 1 n=1 Tax=Cicer arietinum TaxID=3827 RepID=A0A1S2Y9N1_CICAR|nr:BRI1 kinase inhibitor 1 [Cicer arietinum]